MLHRSRQSGFGVGAIAPSDILAYLSIYEQNDAELFFEVIIRVDGLYIERQNKKEAKESDSTNEGSGAVPYAQRSNANDKRR